MFSRQFLTALVFACCLGTAARAEVYQGYVPKGFTSLGESYPGEDASQILSCTIMSSAKLHATLSKEAAHEWYGICANANKVHAQLYANHCLQQLVAACRVATNADDAIRRDPEFWRVLNALMGRADDYGMDD